MIHKCVLIERQQSVPNFMIIVFNVVFFLFYPNFVLFSDVSLSMALSGFTYFFLKRTYLFIRSHETILECKVKMCYLFLYPTLALFGATITPNLSYLLH